MYDSLQQNGRDKIYIWIYEPFNDAKYIIKVFLFFYLSDNGLEMEVIQSRRKMDGIQKELTKETREYIFESYVINGETWFHDLGGLAVYYLSDTPFEKLASGDITDCRLGMRLFTWYTVKLDGYVNFCSACQILILDNDI